MKLNFSPVYLNEETIQQCIRWYNDPEIYPFIHPNFKEEDYPLMTRVMVHQLFEERSDVKRLFILDGSKPIGEISITENFHFLIKTEPKTAWISIMIGEKSYWGQGIASQTMRYLEKTCKDSGYLRIELGVFEHNSKAQNLYTKMGYTAFHIVPKFTYYDGKWWDDVRMEKFL